MPYQFQGQHKDEEVVLISHQHPFVLLRPAIIAVVFLWIPFLAYILLPAGQPLFIIIFVCLLLALSQLLRGWHVWYNSLMLLTNERLVLVEQRRMFHREFVECTLVSIQQVSHTVDGMLATLFGYGTISVYTAGSHEPFCIRNIPQPYELQQEIQRVSVGEGFE